jgi:hypothetical protein
MKKIIGTFMTIAVFTALISTTSCKKECDAGYEGDNCKTEVRAKYLGNYTASETKNGGAAYTYSGSILTSSASVTEIFINRIPNGTGFFNTNVKATVNGNAISIPDQAPDGDEYHITGTGALSGSTLTLTYTVTGPNGATPPVTVTDAYSSVWTKQ